MRTPDSTVVLAARDLTIQQGQPSGSSFSSRDTLAALSATGVPLTVITDERGSMNKANCRWIELKEKKRTCWDLRRSYLRYRLNRLKPTALFVEDPISHRMIENYRDWSHTNRAMIVRGTPAQFDGTFSGRESQLPRVLAEMAAYPYIIGLSERVAAKWRQFSELRNAQFKIIPNCGREDECKRILETDRDELRAKFGLVASDFAVVCVASVQRRKGQDLLISSWSEIKSKIPNAKLIFVGPVVEAWGGKEILEQIEKHPLRDSIQLLGARDDALEITYAADVFILPTREEALPRVILEAMLLKRAIVASDVDGIPDLVDHGTSGFLFDISKPNGMVEALIRLAQDVNLRKNMGEKAAEKYWSGFSRALQIQRYQNFLQELGALS